MYVDALTYLIRVRSQLWKEAVQDTQGVHVILAMVGQLKVPGLKITRNGGPPAFGDPRVGGIEKRLKIESHEERNWRSPLFEDQPEKKIAT